MIPYKNDHIKKLASQRLCSRSVTPFSFAFFLTSNSWKMHKTKALLKLSFSPSSTKIKDWKVKRIPAARSVPMISMSTPSRVRKSSDPPPPPPPHGCRTAKNHNPHKAIQVNVFSPVEHDF